MKKIKIKKILDKNNSKNTIVKVIFKGHFKEEYEGVGVLIREEKNSIRVAFNAKNNEIKDYLDIKRLDIISIDILDESKIKKI